MCRPARQSVTVEDSMSMVHASRGLNAPASDQLKSEPAIVAGIGAATVRRRTPGRLAGPGRRLRRIRDLIEAVFPGPSTTIMSGSASPAASGCHRAAVRARVEDAVGQGQLPGHDPGQAIRARRADVLLLTTLRSHDQYNTTIYGQNDRYRGVFGRRDVVFANPDDMAALGLGGRPGRPEAGLRR
jgi:hypothetical protein